MTPKIAVAEPVSRWARLRLRAVHRSAKWLLQRRWMQPGSGLDRFGVRLARRFAPARLDGRHQTVLFGVVDRVARTLTPTLQRPTVIPTLLGFDLQLDNLSGNQYWRLGRYEVGTLTLIESLLAPGDTFIDVGASVGQMSLHAAGKVGANGRVLAFEPEHTRFQHLQAGIRINGLDGVVEAFPIALSDKAGSAILRIDVNSPSIVGTEAGRDTYEVPTRELDDVLDELAVTTVRLIKLDVEGAELSVLRGATKLLANDDRPIVCYEQGMVSGDDTDPGPFLQALDYRLHRFAWGQHASRTLVPVQPEEKLAFGDNIVACHPGSLRRLESSGMIGAGADQGTNKKLKFR